MDFEKIVNPIVKDIPPSGIRKFFDLANQMEGVISLGVGEPDFATPWTIREAAIYSIEKGKTFYTANQGLLELRKEICKYQKRRFNLDYKPEQLTKRGGTYYSDAACELINSIYNDKRTTMVVSTQNKGALTDLPYDSVAEVSAIITAAGPMPISWGTLKPAARGMVQIMKAMEETTIEAAVTGDYGKALHAFTINPLVPSGQIAKTLLDEMFIAYKKHLPQFADKIAELEELQ